MPIVSKKSDSSSENTNSPAVTNPTAVKAPVRLKSPRMLRSGALNQVSGMRGTFRAQPTGLSGVSGLPSLNGPILKTDSTITARTAVARMPMSRAPLTFRVTSTIISRRPATKTTVGQPRSWPLTPNEISGTPGRVMPASTNPMRAMNRPMPTPMAYFSGSGTASNTATRKPVSTRMPMMMPSSTTRPMACGQVISGAIVKARKLFRPRPAAIASGKRPMAPIAMVSTPATRAVAAETRPIETTGLSTPPMYWPLMSWAVPMIRALSTTM